MMYILQRERSKDLFLDIFDKNGIRLQHPTLENNCVFLFKDDDPPCPLTISVRIDDTGWQMHISLTKEELSAQKLSILITGPHWLAQWIRLVPIYDQYVKIDRVMYRWIGKNPIILESRERSVYPGQARIIGGVPFLACARRSIADYIPKMSRYVEWSPSSSITSDWIYAFKQQLFGDFHE